MNGSVATRLQCLLAASPPSATRPIPVSQIAFPPFEKQSARSIEAIAITGWIAEGGSLKTMKSCPDEPSWNDADFALCRYCNYWAGNGVQILVSARPVRSCALHIRPATLDDHSSLCGIDSVALHDPTRRNDVAAWLRVEACRLAETDGQVTAYGVLTNLFRIAVH